MNCVSNLNQIGFKTLVQQDPEVNDAFSSHFFIFHFFTTFSFFHSPRRSFLLVAPSSSSLLPPRPSFLLVPPSSLFLFLPLPALSQSLRTHKRPFFIDFYESVTDRPTNQPTDGRTDGRTDKDNARTHLKRDEEKGATRSVKK